MKTAFLFPGQGSQFVGMGTDHFRRKPIVLETVSQVEDISGVALQRVMKSGPRRSLQETHVAQLAIFALSIGVLRAFRSETDVVANAMCGHSLGQFSALVAAGAMTLETGTRMIDLRGRLMHTQNQLHDGAMVAVSGLEADDLATRIEGREAVWLANNNAPGQLIVSGVRPELEKLQADLKLQGVSTVALDVAGAYHSPLIAPAAEEFADFVRSAEIRDAQCPVIANTDAAALEHAEDIRAELIQHMLAPVNWRATMNALRDAGIERGVEIGAGRTMKGLWLRNHSHLPCGTSSDSREISATLKMLTAPHSVTKRTAGAEA